MFSTEKKLLGALCASVFALSAMSADVLSESFESGSTVSDLTSAAWTGNGTIVAHDSAPEGALPTAEASNTKKLSVQGNVKCTVTADAAPTLVDLMIQIAKPDEALSGAPEGVDGAQFALGVDVNGALKAYTTGKGSTAGWVDLGVTGTEGSWKRVTLNFDYTAKLCQVIVDGVPALTANGYTTSNKAAPAAGITTGSWYGLLNTPTKLASVEVVGSTAIDEMVVKTGADAEPAWPAPSSTGEKTIPQNWFAKQGIAPAADAADAPDGSGMKIAAKYQTGVSATSGEKFEIKSMAMSGATGAVKTTLTAPAMTPAAGRKNVIVINDGTNTTTQDVPASGTVEINVNKAASGVTKYTYQIKNVAQQ
ncbi:MAG: hypothetical protein Q4G65_06015 [bacterium]|nr:hypothetical protein [bacterium]